MQKAVQEHRHPASVHAMCQTMFCQILGFHVMTLHSVVPSLAGESRYAAKSRHGMIGQVNRAKHIALEFYANELLRIAYENGNPNRGRFQG